MRVIAGKNRGSTGTVTHAYPKRDSVVVDGLNMRKRHIRPRRAGQKGEIIQVAYPMHVSNVQLVCGSCGKATRIGRVRKETGVVRVCKKCSAEQA